MVEKTKKTTKKTTTQKSSKSEKYFEAVGRRKTATARVRITEAKSDAFVINHDKELEKVFSTSELQEVAKEALKKSDVGVKFKVSALINGGGISAQAGALRHGISRALVKFDEQTKNKLKKAGFLKRDPRMKERKKPGLKKARKAPQWSKR